MGTRRTARLCGRYLRILGLTLVVATLSGEVRAGDVPAGVPELSDDYWLAGRWAPLAVGGGDSGDEVVVVDWGLSADDLEGWDDPAQPYPRVPRPRILESGDPERQVEPEPIHYRHGNCLDPTGACRAAGCSSRELVLSDIETYVQDRLRRYAAIWRESERRSRFAWGLTFEDLEQAVEWTDPSGTAYGLVDFECHPSDGGGDGVEYLGIWREGAPENGLTLEAVRFQQLKQGKVEGRILDLELCDSGALREGLDAQAPDGPIVVLREHSWRGRRHSVLWGDFEEFHAALHESGKTPAETFELESLPVSRAPGGGDADYGEWRYLWVYGPDPVSRDWFMATDRYSSLEREVVCLQGWLDSDGGDEICADRPDDPSVSLIDIILGVDEVPDADGDGQHGASHGDGSGPAG